MILKIWIHFATLGGLFAIGGPLNVYGFLKLHKIFIKGSNPCFKRNGNGAEQELTFRSRTSSSAAKRNYRKVAKVSTRK